MSTKQAAVAEPPADTEETPPVAEVKSYPTIGDKLAARYPAAFEAHPDYGVRFVAWQTATAEWDTTAGAELEKAATAIVPDLDAHYKRELEQVHAGREVPLSAVIEAERKAAAKRDGVPTVDHEDDPRSEPEAA